MMSEFFVFPKERNGVWKWWWKKATITGKIWSWNYKVFVTKIRNSILNVTPRCTALIFMPQIFTFSSWNFSYFPHRCSLRQLQGAGSTFPNCFLARLLQFALQSDHLCSRQSRFQARFSSHSHLRLERAPWTSHGHMAPSWSRTAWTKPCSHLDIFLGPYSLHESRSRNSAVQWRTARNDVINYWWCHENDCPLLTLKWQKNYENIMWHWSMSSMIWWYLKCEVTFWKTSLVLSYLYFCNHQRLLEVCLILTEFYGANVVYASVFCLIGDCVKESVDSFVLFLF